MHQREGGGRSRGFKAMMVLLVGAAVIILGVSSIVTLLEEDEAASRRMQKKVEMKNKTMLLLNRINATLSKRQALRNIGGR